MAIGLAASLGNAWRLAIIAPLIWMVALTALRPRDPGTAIEEQAPKARLPRAYWIAWLLLVLGVSMEFSFVYWGSTMVILRGPALTADRRRMLASLFVVGMLVVRRDRGRRGRVGPLVPHAPGCWHGRRHNRCRADVALADADPVRPGAVLWSRKSASWHISKKLQQKVDDKNSVEFGLQHNTPHIELAPLPSSAQYLNVIEAVFSGMAKAIITTAITSLSRKRRPLLTATSWIETTISRRIRRKLGTGSGGKNWSPVDSVNRITAKTQRGDKISPITVWCLF